MARHDPLLSLTGYLLLGGVKTHEQIVGGGGHTQTCPPNYEHWFS